jgi:beta-glucosidase
LVKRAVFPDLESTGVSVARILLWASVSVRYTCSFSPSCLCADDFFIADLNSAFPAGINVAATWDKTLAYLRGKAMGEEFHDKGADIVLGPVAGPLGKYPDGGRNWEGFSPDPVLTGALFAESIRGIQDAGVIATAKHFILNEQEHFRQVSEAQGYGYNITETLSSNLDDKTMHELYLWPFADGVRGKIFSRLASMKKSLNPL